MTFLHLAEFRGYIWPCHHQQGLHGLWLTWTTPHTQSLLQVALSGMDKSASRWRNFCAETSCHMHPLRGHHRLPPQITHHFVTSTAQTWLVWTGVRLFGVTKERRRTHLLLHNTSRPVLPGRIGTRMTLKPKGNPLFEENEVHFWYKTKATTITPRDHPCSPWRKAEEKDGLVNPKAG